MLDLMEMRGFRVGARGIYLVTPDGVQYAVQQFPDVSDVKCAFAAFETLNSNYQ